MDSATRFPPTVTQRIAEYRFDGGRDSSHSHRHELCDRSNGDVWKGSGNECDCCERKDASRRRLRREARER